MRCWGQDAVQLSRDAVGRHSLPLLRAQQRPPLPPSLCSKHGSNRRHSFLLTECSSRRGRSLPRRTATATPTVTHGRSRRSLHAEPLPLLLPPPRPAATRSLGARPPPLPPPRTAAAAAPSAHSRSRHCSPHPSQPVVSAATAPSTLAAPSTPAERSQLPPPLLPLLPLVLFSLRAATPTGKIFYAAGPHPAPLEALPQICATSKRTDLNAASSPRSSDALDRRLLSSLPLCCPYSVGIHGC